MKTYRTETLGCKVNQYETREIEEVLERAGLGPAPDGTAADLVVVNTCVVTADAARQCRRAIRQARRDNPTAQLIVTGCYAAEVERSELAAIKGLSLVIADKDELRRQLREELTRGRHSNEESGISHFRGHARAFVKIQDGCDQFCSYCIVPLVRPKLWSRPAAEVLAEVRRLVGTGHREIVLSGIHLGRYGKHSSENMAANSGRHGTQQMVGASALSQLVSQLLALPLNFRIRLSSIEAVEVDDALLDLLAAHPNHICPQLHLPLQSGDDAILRAMRRPYTLNEFLDRVSRAREKVPGLAVTTDLIVGFPGESAATFARLCELARQTGFSRLHVFPFSPRQGTPAADLPGQVPPEERKRRADTLRVVGEELAARFAATLVGRDVTVLVESVDRERGVAEGYNEHYVRTQFPISPASPIARRDLVPVHVTSSDGALLLAEVV
jgi:threonylcarbamoyladenosine tRNA methylthiotransferase MtaB